MTGAFPIWARPAWAYCLSALLLNACMVGPDYHRPSAPMTARFKEQLGQNLAQPADQADKGRWWAVYNDPVLDNLESQIIVNNQTVLADEAAVRNAIAVVAEVRAQLFPTVGVSAMPGYGGVGNRTGAVVQDAGTVDWQIDLWGQIRRQIESAKAARQVTQAQLANAILSAQSQLAQAYFELRATDALHDLYESSVKDYQKSLDIARAQYNAGTVSAADVVSAETLVASTQAQLINTGVERAQLEHAIAALIGTPPAAFSLAKAAWNEPIPPAPDAVPSTLLQRRPDIAAAERTMQEENAQIGVAVAAFYPAVSLSALYNVTGNPVQGLLAAGDRTWSAALGISETLFAGGERSAAVAAARANYETSVATYRQTVLTAFQQVEDDLAALRIYGQQAEAQQKASDLGQKSVTLEIANYKAGTVVYTSVLTQQIALLGIRQTALQVRQNRYVSSVQLITALGGGWDAGALNH